MVSNGYRDNIFRSSFPNIFGNEKLRKPQVEAYMELHRHFIEEKKTSHALVVLPTGVGKTGLIGIAPYKISEGKVLVIAPRLAIKDNLLNHLNPINPENFWMKREIFKNPNLLPSVSEYTKGLNKEVLDESNIIILNAQKLQDRLDSSILNFLPENYFDMIIIDEAHHSTASTWLKTVKHFSEAKVIKLTGTPFRTDGQKIEGELVYKYKLGVAMANNYIKSLRNISYEPDELYFTIDENEKNKYSIEEIYELGIKDENWVTRSVAFSLECSKKVVDTSIELLKEKRNASNIPHKIIAVACSIFHAEQIKQLYEDKDLRVAIVHSKLDKNECENAFSDIENNRVDVVVNVAMLGEGYDHPYLSIAAVFRPFKSELPYIQFVGRILRYINDDDAKPIDNIGQIVSHKNLELENLWREYKKEIDTIDIIKKLEEVDVDSFGDDNSIDIDNKNVIEFGNAYEIGEGSLISDDFLDEKIKKDNEEYEKKYKEQINIIMQTMNISHDEAKNIVDSVNNNDIMRKRPDLMFRNSKRGLDKKIREEIVPELVVEFKSKNIEVSSLDIFRNSAYRWISSRSEDPAAMLAIYFNKYLKDKIGKDRSKWSQSDFENAYEKVDNMNEYLRKYLE